jgi:hypothetical protein
VAGIETRIETRQAQKRQYNKALRDVRNITEIGVNIDGVNEEFLAAKMILETIRNRTRRNTKTAEEVLKDIYARKSSL